MPFPSLIPPEVATTIPPLYAQEDIPDPIVHVKFYALGSAATWYITEYSDVAPDGAPRIAFGYVTGLSSDEWGYVSLDEMESLRYCGVVPRIERDLYFRPCAFSESLKRRSA